jgi:mannitol-1-phosphate 5-dehydrogenase
MKTAIHFGAGNIGRGFIGFLLSKSAYKVVFADVNTRLITELRQRASYTVEILGRNWAEHQVEPVDGIISDDPELFQVFLQCSIVTTAVGPNILPHIAPIIAHGLEHRRDQGITEPMAIIACENMIGGSTKLALEVEKHLSPEGISYFQTHVGFPDAAVDRIIPPGEAFDDILRVRVEEYSEWVVDAHGFKGPIPQIAGMLPVENLAAYLERKLFTLNTGHATAGYLGARRRYRTVGEAIRDPEVAQVVKGAMIESGEVLIRRYGFDRQDHHRYIDKILERFSNPALIDEIPRIARQPLRKLSYHERLIKPLRGALEYGLPNTHLVQATAAALAYRHPDDPDTLKLEEELSKPNMFRAIQTITGLGKEDGQDQLISQIIDAYEDISMSLLMEQYMRRLTKVVTLAEAKESLASLISDAFSGKEVILAHRGLPMARLIPIHRQGGGFLPGSD